MDELTIINIVIGCVAIVLACGGTALKYYIDVRKGVTVEQRLADLEAGIETIMLTFESTKHNIENSK